MAEIQMLVSDPTLAHQVEAVAAAADLPVTSGLGPQTAIVVVDDAGLDRLTAAPPRLGTPVVLVARDADEQTWQVAAARGIDQVVALPGGAPLLDSRLRSLCPAPGAGRLVRVIGVRGGCGATTLAVGLARTLREHGPVVLVDADRHGPGLETPLGLGDTDGVRWPALADIRGRMPATSLTGRLPGQDGVWVLSHRVGDGAGGSEAWAPVVGSLLGADVTAVADVPHRALEQHPPVGPTHDVVVLPRDVAGLVCAGALLRDGHTTADPVVVVRGGHGPVEFGAVRAAFDGLPVIPLPHCRSVVGAADFGDLGDAVTRGPFRRVCRDILAHVARRPPAAAV